MEEKFLFFFKFVLLLLSAAETIAQDEDYQTKTFFAPGWNEDRLDYEQSFGSGNWTPFLDADRPWGLGEFEDVWRERMHYRGDCRALWCRSPKAMEVGMSSRVLQYLPDASLEKAWKCTNFFHEITPDSGYHCLQRDQKRYRGPKDAACYGIGGICHENGMKPTCGRCFDAKVRYFCLQDEADCRVNAFPGPIP